MINQYIQDQALSKNSTKSSTNLSEQVSLQSIQSPHSLSSRDKKNQLRLAFKIHREMQEDNLNTGKLAMKNQQLSVILATQSIFCLIESLKKRLLQNQFQTIKAKNCSQSCQDLGTPNFQNGSFGKLSILFDYKNLDSKQLQASNKKLGSLTIFSVLLKHLFLQQERFLSKLEEYSMTRRNSQTHSVRSMQMQDELQLSQASEVIQIPQELCTQERINQSELNPREKIAVQFAASSIMQSVLQKVVHELTFQLFQTLILKVQVMIFIEQQNNAVSPYQLVEFSETNDQEVDEQFKTIIQQKLIATEKIFRVIEKNIGRQFQLLFNYTFSYSLYNLKVSPINKTNNTALFTSKKQVENLSLIFKQTQSIETFEDFKPDISHVLAGNDVVVQRMRIQSGQLGMKLQQMQLKKSQSDGPSVNNTETQSIFQPANLNYPKSQRDQQFSQELADPNERSYRKKSKKQFWSPNFILVFVIFLFVQILTHLASKKLNL